MVEYKGTLLAVSNMKEAIQFYKAALDVDVVRDAGTNVLLTGGIFLQTADTWAGFIERRPANIIFGNNAVELYFETDNMDAFMKRLETVNSVSYLHPLVEHSWGQKAIRFYDLDKHIIEVAESIIVVIKRFIRSGLTVEETAKRMGVDVSVTKATLAQYDGL